MTRSFGLVEEKLREAEYFLHLLSKTSRHSQEAKFSFSAFVSASRSVTFVLQASLTGIEGFEEWYATAQATLRTDQLAPHFVEFRNSTQKTGENPIGRVGHAHLRQYLAGQLNGLAPTHVLVHPRTSELVDALDVCNSYLTSVTRIVYDCYVRFRTFVDPQWYFTEEAFKISGKTLTDALQEMGYPPSWLDAAPSREDAWHILSRLNPDCAINDLFQVRLGKIILGPIAPRPNKSFKPKSLRGSA
ncbi:hypothetical protein LYZ77_17190 [Xanthomonas hortorum pv. vitians]|uniref:hypothetical protein n=1 Tax=Xanthomonas TaxID=338 RepID=UPI0012A83C3F|nr:MULTISPECIES: hypothetical protein [Xanthomonas]MCE4286601.1 hypothetical protein [Xanthomonas hortorum pv. vitians]MEA9491096.1 hypothetical protein [Xanthomonas campestris]MEA9509639.1 hypothetical protein [Xanthomonas campestris]QEW13976.1 hypothetical protein DYQ48_02035 [Xanthomonas hortorum]